MRPRERRADALPAKNDGWCEEPRHGSYNRPIRLPSSAGHETMWRDDRLYDIVGVLDWNISPRVSGRGSAIFLHLARPGYRPTAGCIALSRRDLGLLLAAAGRHPCFLVRGKAPKGLQRSLTRTFSVATRLFRPGRDLETISHLLEAI